MLLSGIIAALTSLLIPIIILLLLLPNACYVVEQQHAVIIERLGKFNRIVSAGFHMKDAVCSPGGATIKGVVALEDAGMRSALVKAIDATLQ